MPRPKNGLSDKQRVFIDEYLLSLNATQAAIKAGYSKKTAKSIGQENLTKPDIAAAIKEKLDERASQNEVTADRVIKELAKIGFANMADYCTWDDTGIKLKKGKEINEDQRAAISEIVVQKGGAIKFKLHDKKAALDSLGRHLGIFKEDEKGGNEVYFFTFEEVKKPDDAGT